jgi:hypothetical protein
MYVCEKEVPCMMVEYIHCHDRGIIDIVIRRATQPYYTRSKWVQYKKVDLCLECLAEKKYAESRGPPKIQYIDPTTIKVVRKYLTPEVY